MHYFCESKESVLGSHISVVLQIVSEKFYNCSLVLVSKLDEIDNHDLEFFQHRLTTFSSQTSYLVRIPSTKNWTKNNVIHKHTSYCKTVITFMNSVNIDATVGNFSTQFLELFSGSTRRELLGEIGKNYFIFVIDSIQLWESFLFSRIGREIKFKIAILPNKRIFSFCIFCNSTNFLKITLNGSNIPFIQELFPDFTKNLRGYQLTASALRNGDLVKIENSTFVRNRVVETDLFYTIQEILNFTYVFAPCSGLFEGTTGLLFPNKTWVGCVADVLYGSSDIALAIGPNKDRFSAVQFTTPIRFTEIVFVVRKSSSYFSWLSVFFAFGPYGWTLTLVSIFSISFLIHLIENVLQYQANESMRRHFRDDLLYFYGYLIGQHIPIDVKTIVGKFILMIWLWCGFVLGVFYSSSLQSLIVSPGHQIVPETMPILLQSPEFRWGASQSFIDNIGGQVFKQSHNPVLRKLQEKMDADKGDIECLARAASTNYACFHFNIYTQMHIANQFTNRFEQHPFHFATDSAYYTSTSYVTRKGEVFTSNFNQIISWFVDMGLGIRTTRKNLGLLRKKKQNGISTNEGTNNLPFSNGNGQRSISVENVKAAFLVLMLGLLIAIGSFIRELIQRCLKNSFTD
ncbi:unnamed protein product [Orchesella dallaii]|uniref:Ionotropic glutamate receptor C-terminal domain-containing protein n=1 Tax=Orchesella dallaii TaxID=48710 RepID=A0ABP1R9F8_9HEXA